MVSASPAGTEQTDPFKQTDLIKQMDLMDR